MLNLLRKMLTEPDGTTFCPVRMCLGAAGTFYHAGAAWMVLGQGVHIDMPLLHSYLVDLLSLAGTTAVSVGVKSSLKADAPSQP